MRDETSEREYWASVGSIAEDTVQAIRDGEIPADDWTDYVWESVDGSWWIIWNHAALAVCQHTDSIEAFEDYGPLSSDGGFYGMICRVAFCAMNADVCDRVHTLLEQEEEAVDA